MNWDPQPKADARSPRSEAEAQPPQAIRARWEPASTPLPRPHERVEEAEVGLHVQPQVANGMAQVGDPLDAHPERETLVALGIQAAVLEHDRMDHAGPEDRHPAALRASR